MRFEIAENSLVDGRGRQKCDARRRMSHLSKPAILRESGFSTQPPSVIQCFLHTLLEPVRTYILPGSARVEEDAVHSKAPYNYMLWCGGKTPYSSDDTR